MNAARKIFWFVNKFFMVPTFRMGLGAFICNPLTGYIMVIKNIGRKSGKRYFTPTNYAIFDGSIYCIAGFGRKAHWYMNIMSTPHVEIIMPGGTISGTAAEVTKPEEALKACKQILKNAGFAGFFEGFNPRRAPDERFKQMLEHAPIVRITPNGIGSGPLDAGGWHWMPILAALIALIILLLR